MAAVINTNISSLNSQRNLSTSQSALSTSLQRLSSGMRINSAKDDAAGLAISDRMTSQIRGMTQATRNANDGVSLAQTAEGALASSGDILQRIRELAVQSSNATNSSSDRQALQTEVGQLGSELNRIAQTTSFNGQALLDGTMGTANFQVGADANQLISASGANFLTNTYGNNRIANDASAVKKDAVGNAVVGKLTISGSIGTTTVDTTAAVAETAPGAGDAIKGSTAKSVAADINSQTAKTGVTASAQTDVNLNLGAESYSFSIGSDNAKPVTVSFAVSGTASTAADYAAGINAINAQTAKTGVTAQYDSVNKGMKLTNASGENISLTQGTTANVKFDVDGYKADGKVQAAAQSIITAANAATVNGRVTFDSQNSFSVTETTTTGLAIGKATAQGSTLNSVSTLDVTTFDGAQLALKIADAALATVNGQRAQYGALQSRFSSAISNLQSTTENLSASRSRIVDTDFASETANMTRGQILQQAGTAMLAQANSLPNGVLSLLRG
ncbi:MULTISPECIES: flagellin [Janthinobacterium]|uniref:flagellin N-terminal helical domain-containing protein n=1 Tax=Janthinobacterium TaxID=29580 RepID=UPI00053713D7|nr:MULTISPECIES: flagellin [Janthinobacterium]KHA76134.1 flagellin [Janthinobacterium lividum]MCX7294984.1 flagellin [Janthinobacterium sp.]MDO8066483.1 flagellin [Janthinobacterium sp. SUN206]MDO8072706.1 flagellin [Janthinobacterium sp. SUN176]PIF11907.1 flagellin [Janthinobacterium sp. 13]